MSIWASTSRSATSWYAAGIKNATFGQEVEPERQSTEVSTRPEQIVPTRPEQIVIGVVGVTGSGKSSLIQRLTKRPDIEIGDGPDSVTQEIRDYLFRHNSTDFVLIDSPGFDDSGRSDEDVFNDLADWMANSYRKGRRMNGLLYLHPVISTRQRGSEIRNLRMFKKLCGENNFGNVALGLTFCDQEALQVIAQRRKELVETPEWWGEMVAKGSQVHEIPLEREKCLQILDTFRLKKDFTMRIQEEVVQLNISIDNTEAAQVVLHKKELDSIRARERSELSQMYAEHEKRMFVANAAYQVKLRTLFESIGRRQALQEQALRMSKELGEQLAKQESLRLEETKMLEAEEARRLSELEDAFRKVRLENLQIEKRLKKNRETKDLHRLKPLLKARYEMMAASGEEFSKALSAGNIKQYHTVYAGLEDPGWCHKFRNEDEEEVFNVWACFISGFCFRCLKALKPLELTYNCALCPQELGTEYPLYGFPGFDVSRSTFQICVECKVEGRSCLLEDHEVVNSRLEPNYKPLAKCEYYQDDYQFLAPCYTCLSNVETWIVHCCICEWQACMKCWGNGSTCDNKSHEIHLVSRCPPELRRKALLTDPYLDAKQRAGLARLFSVEDDVFDGWKRKVEDGRLRKLDGHRKRFSQRSEAAGRSFWRTSAEKKRNPY